ncbi:PLP-dependent aminotransferase family protein [Paraburkholderia sp. J12]|uniref:aminotransferase-like domain-containing protein n=1 Tax=Paraburkholderia sp. J12 TaxID=2805432 RepID=UPI002ABDC352|nr:PLP-dependent aminotransferase family protein [Paraburkholderia sp. J12]
MYEQIATALIRDIQSGKLKPGDLLPPNRELSASLGVTVGTVSRAFAVALRANLIETGARRGTRVKAPAETVEVDQQDLPRALERGIADLRGHQAAVKHWWGSLAQEMASLHSSPALGNLLRYDNPGGRLSHREVGAQWLGGREGRHVDPAKVVVTDGAQHALLCALLACTKAGDRIATERLTYTGLKTAASMLGLEVVPVDMDEEGMRSDSLRAALADGSVKAIVCVPNIHNPTTTTMSSARRIEIAGIAEQSGVPILEDDVYGYLTDADLPSLASLAPDCTIRFTSFSKTLGPGLRVGFMETPGRFTSAVIEAVRASTWMASPISAELAAKLVASGQADQMLLENRMELQRRNQALSEILGARVQTTPYAPHAWLTLPEPWTGRQFCSLAETMGYLVLSAEAFGVDGTAPVPAVRLSVSAAQDVDELNRFATLAAHSLRSGPRTPEQGLFA